MSVERWAFSESELEHPKRCRGDDELWSSHGGNPSVIVLRCGHVTDYCVDGLRVDDEEREHAERDEELVHPPDDTHAEYESTEAWRDVIVSDDGSFIRFGNADSALPHGRCTPERCFEHAQDRRVPSCRRGRGRRLP